MSSASYPLDETLEVVKTAGVSEGVAYLKEHTGDMRGSLEVFSEMGLSMGSVCYGRARQCSCRNDLSLILSYPTWFFYDFVSFGACRFFSEC
jgi:hypothetical protein